MGRNFTPLHLWTLKSALFYELANLWILLTRGFKLESDGIICAEGTILGENCIERCIVFLCVDLNEEMI